MISIKKFSKHLLKEERGQGMVEYILLLVIVVAVVSLFKQPLMDMVNGKIDDLKKGVGSISTGQ
jgi:Flp pilus assembly pilin Flp